MASLADTRQVLYDQSLRQDMHEKESVTKQRIDNLMMTLEVNLPLREQSPGVPLTVIYSAQLDSVDGWKGDAVIDPIQITAKKDKYYEKGTDVVGRGDGTVNTFGALIRPLKWAHQF